MHDEPKNTTGIETTQPVERLLYLHGFRSSAQSTKARQMAAWVAEQRPGVSWECPQLPASPAAAVVMLRELTEEWPAASSAIVGSSLGGFYASVLSEASRCRCVLINPAVDPARDLAGMIGNTTMWHSNEVFEFRVEFVDELRRMTAQQLGNQQRTLALIAKGDEVLDWREMAARHAGSQITLIEGGDHAFSDFEQHLKTIGEFFGWP